MKQLVQEMYHIRSVPAHGGRKSRRVVPVNIDCLRKPGLVSSTFDSLS